MSSLFFVRKKWLVRQVLLSTIKACGNCKWKHHYHIFSDDTFLFTVTSADTLLAPNMDRKLMLLIQPFKCWNTPICAKIPWKIQTIPVVIHSSIISVIIIHESFLSLNICPTIQQYNIAQKEIFPFLKVTKHWKKFWCAAATWWLAKQGIVISNKLT